MQNNSKEQAKQGVNILDLLVYLLSKWKWYLLSLAICLSYAFYSYYKAPLVFFRSATIMIKSPANKPVATGMDRFDNIVNKVNLENEELQLKSKKLMTDVITRLDADIDYQVKEKFRYEELYSNSPVKVKLNNVMPERSLGFSVTIISQDQVKVTNVFGLEGSQGSYTLNMGDSLAFNSESIRVFPTEHLDKSWIGKTINISKVPISSRVGYFLSTFTVRQESGGSSILTLSMKDANGNRAGDVLNTLITAYNEQAIKDKNQISINSAQFIEERLKVIEAELGGVEDELLNYRIENNLLNVSTSTGQYVNQYNTYSDAAVALETQLKVTQYVLDYLNDPSKIRELIPSNSGIGNEDIEQQITQYNNMKLRRDRLVMDSSTNNPVITELTRAMHELRQSIIRSVNHEILALSVKRDDAIKQQNAAEANMINMPKKERGMQTIARQQSIKESLYLYLLNKREENALAQSMVDNNANVIDEATGPARYISPERNKLIGLGLMMGLAIPTVVFLFIMFMDTKIHSRKDLQGKTNIPFAGEIPYDDELKKKRKKAKKTLDESYDEDDDDNSGMIVEAFKMLRTNLTFMAKRENHKIITFTSFNEGAGKTFISSNLGMSLAASKKKVCMVDLDIRKRSLSHLFSKRRYVGVTNYLADDSIELDDIIHHHEKIDNLDIIYGGQSAPNPAELLTDKRLEDMFEELKQRYDYIIADNVPVGIVADATISNRISDMTIFVIRAGKLDRRQIPDLESLYQEGKLRNMSMVLNGVDPKYRGYGYRYGYGYGYGYGYRYGYTYGEEKKKKKRRWF